MDVYLQWLLAASAFCLMVGWLGYRALRRAASKREAERARAEAADWAEAERVAEAKAARHRARSEAVAQEAARVAAAEAERIEAAVVAVHEAARAHAQRLAAEETERARLQAEVAQRAARLATQQAAEEARSRIAQAEAELQARREAEQVARLAAEAALARESAPAPPYAPPLAKAPEQTIVMVADDSKIVRVKTGRLLAQHRYQVVYAIDGLEAVQQIEASLPDVVITDVDMPGMDGFELTRHVRQNPLTAHIPVIMITAADDKHRADADSAGVSVLMGKPYPEDELIAHIRRAMNPAEARAGVPA